MPAVEERSIGCFVLALVLYAGALAAPYGKIGENARPGGATGALDPGLGNQTGVPSGDEHQDGRYSRVNFERGAIRWAPDTGGTS